MNKIFAGLVLVTCLYAQPTNFKLLSKTAGVSDIATGFVFLVDISCGSQITMEVSTDPSYSPLVNDVDPTQFTNANIDVDRSDTQGKNFVTRQIAIGKRYVETNLSGTKVSRALQASTVYYYRLTDCKGSLTGSVTTFNPQLGFTFPEPYPNDPNTPGEYGWPDATDTSDNSASCPTACTNKDFIDPQTGIHVVKVSTGGDIKTVPNSSTGVAKVAFVDFSGKWTIGGTAVFTADGTSPNPKLFVPMDLSTLIPSPIASESQAAAIFDYMKINVNMQASNSGADGLTHYCISKDQTTCDSATFNQALTTGGVTYNLGGTKVNFADWYGGHPATIATSDIYRTCTVVSLASGVATRTSGDLISANLINGGIVYLNAASSCTGATYGTGYIVSAVPTATTVTVASPPADGTYTLLSPQFGILIWKDSTTVGTSITVTSVTYDTGWSIPYSTFLNGAYMDWMSNATGGGYRHWMTAGGSQLGLVAWTDTTNAHTNLLGWAGIPFGDPNFGNPAANTMSGGFGSAFDITDPQSYYGLVTDGTGNRVMGKITSTTNAQNTLPVTIGTGYAPNRTTQNLSPTPNNLLVEFNAFDSTFDTATNTTISLDGIQGNTVIMRASPGAQDNMPGGWVVGWDVTKGPASPSNNPVVNMLYSNGPICRYCVLHGIVQSGNTPWVDIAMNCAGGTGTCHTGGTFTAPLYTSTLDLRFGTTLGSAMSPSDTTITVVGQPTTTNIAVGDVFQIELNTTNSELVKITGGTFPTFTILRSYNQGGVGKSHVNGSAVMGICSTYAESGGDAYWFNMTDGSFSYDSTIPGGHRMYRSGTYIEQNGSVDCDTATGNFACTAFRAGSAPTMFGTPINYYINNLASWAGINRGVAGDLNLAGSTHPSALQTDRTYALDNLQLNNSCCGLFPVTNYTVTLVSAPYIYKVTPPATLHRKLVPTMAYSGDHLLLDISAKGASLNNTAADNWKYCVPATAGDCWSGSAVGEVYVNVKPLSLLGCQNTSDTQSGSSSWVRDICVYESATWYWGGITQLLINNPDPLGIYKRRLSSVGNRYHRATANFVSQGKASPDSKMYGWISNWWNRVRGEYMTGVLPTIPASDGLNRNTLRGIIATVGSAPPGTVTADIVFYYPSLGYCGTQRENCIASTYTGTSVNTSNPYYWEQTDIGYPRMSCPAATGCSITIPGIPTKNLQWYWRFFDGSGNMIGGGPSYTWSQQVL